MNTKGSFFTTVAALGVMTAALAVPAEADVEHRVIDQILDLSDDQHELVRKLLATDFATDDDIQDVLRRKADDLGVTLELNEIGSIISAFGQGRVKSTLDIIAESDIIAFVTQDGAAQVIETAYDESVSQLVTMTDQTVKTALDRYVVMGTFDNGVLSTNANVMLWQRSLTSSTLENTTVAGAGSHTAMSGTNGQSSTPSAESRAA